MPLLTEARSPIVVRETRPQAGIAAHGAADMRSGDEWSLRDLLAIEDDDAIPAVRCPATGIPLWACIRVPFIRLILSDLLYQSSLAALGSAKTSRVAMIASLARAGLHNYRHRAIGVKKIVVMSSGWGNSLVEGKWLNRYGDHFAGVFGSDTAMVEEMRIGAWPFPRHFEDVLFHQPIRLAATLAGRAIARVRPSGPARALIETVRERAARMLGWNMEAGQAEWLKRLLESRAAALPYLVRGYDRLLDRLRPRLILVEEACYGGHLTALITAARRRQIVTAEYQHGAVSAGHDAYNVAPALAASSAYRDILPDYFLGYGSWWNEQIGVPVTKVAIGNPHRGEGHAQSHNAASARDVLVLGDGVDLDHYLGMARAVAALVGDSARVVYRPHPIERARVDGLFPDGDAGRGVSIDRRPDIYEAFGTATAVVSEISTGLFEAIGRVDRIFIWDTPKSRFAYPAHPFQTFGDAAALAALLSDGASGRLDEGRIDAIWAPHWKGNYRRFVQDVMR